AVLAQPVEQRPGRRVDGESDRCAIEDKPDLGHLIVPPPSPRRGPGFMPCAPARCGVKRVRASDLSPIKRGSRPQGKRNLSGGTGRWCRGFLIIRAARLESPGPRGLSWPRNIGAGEGGRME